MMDPKAAERSLASTALDQGGYFTAKQALSAGYSYQNQRYHTLNGDWTRAARGVYRLRDFPTQPREDLIVVTLLSANRTGEPQAVVSHETALRVHDISDANPAKIHLTVPVRFRKSLPGSVILHRANLTRRDWEDRGGYRVTTPLRTLLDIASDPISWPLLVGAVRDALREGLVRGKQLLSADGSDDAKIHLRLALSAAQQSSGVTVQDAKTGSTGPKGVRWQWRTPPPSIADYLTSTAASHDAKDGDKDR